MININFVDEEYTDEHSDEIRDWLEEVGEKFEESENFKNLNQNEQESCSFLLNVFFESSYGYCLVGPGKINKNSINEMMLDVMPRKISANKATFEAFSPVMEQFLQWCEEENYILNTKKLRDHINKMSNEMLRRSQDPSYWGMAKSLMSGGPFNLNFGNDYSQIEHAYQSNLETFKRDSPKIGRNDSCECGSGKKYKKCCLNK